MIVGVVTGGCYTGVVTGDVTPLTRLEIRSKKLSPSQIYFTLLYMIYFISGNVTTPPETPGTSRTTPGTPPCTGDPQQISAQIEPYGT